LQTLTGRGQWFSKGEMDKTMEYFLAINGQQRGPFPVQDLIRQGMKSDTLVWAEGMANWTPAHQIAELARVFTPPPISPAAAPQWQSPVFTPSAYPAAPPPSGGPQSGSPQYPPPPMQSGFPGMQYGGYAVPPNINSTKLAAGLCGIFLGSLGVHKFILGRTGAGLIMLLISICTLGFAAGIVHIIGMIEGIIYLSRSDADFYRMNVLEKRNWF
jgi:TM2 domain-containing membrane protein YozV